MPAMWIGQQCLACEKGKFQKIKKNIDFTYEGVVVEFKDVPVFKCDTCEKGEFIEDKFEKMIDYTLMEMKKNIKLFLKSAT